MKQTYLTLFAIVSFCSTSSAVLFSTNFDSAPYTFGGNVDGVDGWNLSSGSPTSVTVATIQVSPFPGPSSGGQALHFGFDEIAASSAYLSRNSGVSLVGNAYGYTQFKTSFTIQDSIPTFTNRDTFAFTFRGTADSNLLTISLTPTAQSVTPQFTPNRIDQYSYTSDFAAGNLNIGSLNEFDWSVLDVLFTPNGANVDFDIKFAGVSAASGTLLNAATQTLSTYGVLWTPLDANDEGNNVLILDDVSLVPEPSSALLVSLAGLAFLSRRRRA